MCFQAIEVDFTALDRGRDRQRRDAFRKAQGLLPHLSAFHRACDLSGDFRLFLGSTPVSTGGRFIGSVTLMCYLGIAVDLSQ